MEGTFNLLVDLDGPSPTCEIHNYRNGIQIPLYLTNTLSLLHLYVRKTKGKQPLIGYNQSQIITYNEYL
jgi:hypothetical protein